MACFVQAFRPCILHRLVPRGEPQLGRRGLYRALGGDPDPGAATLAMLWLLNLSDGDHSLLDVAERSNVSFDRLAAAARSLREAGLLSPREES